MDCSQSRKKANSFRPSGEPTSQARRPFSLSPNHRKNSLHLPLLINLLLPTSSKIEALRDLRDGAFNFQSQSHFKPLTCSWSPNNDKYADFEEKIPLEVCLHTHLSLICDNLGKKRVSQNLDCYLRWELWEQFISIPFSVQNIVTNRSIKWHKRWYLHNHSHDWLIKSTLIPKSPSFHDQSTPFSADRR